MNWNVITTPLITITTGVAVFVIGQVILECYVKPLQEYHKIKAEVSYLLVLYANVFMNPEIIGANKKFEFTLEENERRKKAGNELREAAAILVGFKQQKPFFVRKDNVEKASSGLMGLSNGLYVSARNEDKRIEQNGIFAQEIKEALHLK